MMESESQTTVSSSVEDRRREPRYAVQGKAVMVIQAGRKLEVTGSLVDQSEHGLCISHMYPALASGMEVEIHLENGDVRVARVMWNRINADGVQSGFYIP